MDFPTSKRRLLKTVGRVALVWLVSVSAADAGLPRRCAARLALAAANVRLSPLPLGGFPGSGHSWLTHKRLPKPAKCRARVSANGFVPRVGHAIVHRPRGGAAVQNDEAPAAHDAARDSVDPSLASLGLISIGGKVSPSSRPFSPQSPRGPPHAA